MISILVFSILSYLSLFPVHAADLCAPGFCLSQHGFCGQGEAYCGKGCQQGACYSPSISGTPSAGTGPCCPAPDQCRSQWGFCGTGSDYCGAGCQCGTLCLNKNDGAGSIAGTWQETGRPLCQVRETFNLPAIKAKNWLQVDYCPQQFRSGIRNQTASLKMDATCGTRLSSRRFFYRGSVKARLKVVNSPGVVTSFILRSAETGPQDEIDFEWITRDGRAVTQTNIFVDSVLDYTNAAYHPTTVDLAAGYHWFQMDWNADSIKWFVDGIQIRELKKGSAPFPRRPMRVEIGIWDGSNTSGWAGTTDFSKGPFQFHVDELIIKYSC